MSELASASRRGRTDAPPEADAPVDGRAPDPTASLSPPSSPPQRAVQATTDQIGTSRTGPGQVGTAQVGTEQTAAAQAGSAPAPAGRVPTAQPATAGTDGTETVRTPGAGPATAATAPTPSTIAGTLLGGRYRLRTRVGSDTAAGAEFWQAEDTILQRDVAATVLRRLSPGPGPTARADGRGDGDGEDGDPTGTARAGEILVRALRTGSFEHPGCARLLDVLTPGSTGVPEDVLGAAVTEWVPGRSLAEAVTDGLVRPLTAARWLTPLAAAAEEAHRHGLVLGCDHPQRVRITPDGRVRLCFALPRPDTTPADDVRGLGAVLYSLLTSRWPLSGADAARAGLAAAPRSENGSPVPAAAQRQGVPVELDTLTTGLLSAVDAVGHVHTAAAVHRLLSEIVVENDTLFPPVRDGAPAEPEDTWQDGGRTAPPDRRRRRKLVVGVGVLAVSVLVVLAFVGVKVGALFSDGSGPVIKVGNDPVATATQPPVEPSTGGGLATAADVEVYAPDGDADNSSRAARVIDGDLSSSWRTYSYRQQFPGLKPGVGLMVSFPSAVQLASLSILSPSPGSVVQVRTASTQDAALADTSLVADATLGDGTTDISLAGSQPATHLLLWITKLGGGGTDNVTEIAEVQFHRAAG